MGIPTHPGERPVPWRPPPRRPGPRLGLALLAVLAAAPPLAGPFRTLTEGLAASVSPVAHPDESWSAPPATLGDLLVLAALVFVIGME